MTTRDLDHWQDRDFGAIGSGRPRSPAASPAPNTSPSAVAVTARATRRRTGKLRLVRLGLGSAVLITLLTLAAVDRTGTTAPPAPARLDLRVEAPTLRTPPALWQPHERPDITIAATPAELNGSPASRRAERHSRGASRVTFGFGGFHAPEPYLHLVITRDSPETAARSFYVATALHAAEEGLAIHRIRHEEGVNSQRLAMITAGMTLEDGRRRSCIAFRGETGAGQTVLSGWYCAAAPDKHDLACLMDSLDIIAVETGAPLFPANPEATSDCRRAPQAGAQAGRQAGTQIVEGQPGEQPGAMPGSGPIARDIAGLLAALEAETDEAGGGRQAGDAGGPRPH